VIKLLMSDGSKQVQLAMFSEEEMRPEEGGRDNDDGRTLMLLSSRSFKAHEVVCWSSIYEGLEKCISSHQLSRDAILGHQIRGRRTIPASPDPVTVLYKDCMHTCG
jgi:hypothetical protein